MTIYVDLDTKERWEILNLDLPQRPFPRENERCHQGPPDELLRQCALRAAEVPKAVAPTLDVDTRKVSSAEIQLEPCAPPAPAPGHWKASPRRAELPPSRLRGLSSASDLSELSDCGRNHDVTEEGSALTASHGLIQRLTSPDYLQQVRALAALAASAPARGDDRVINAVCGRLWNGAPRVREAAARALGALADAGDADVFEALRTCAADDSCHAVRSAAVEALGQVGIQGDPALTDAVLDGLHDGNAAVRATSALVLSRLSARGDRSAIEALRRGLGDEDAIARHACVDALLEVADRGDRRLIADIALGIGSLPAPSRLSSVFALVRLTDPGDSDAVIEALCSRFRDSEPRVRIEALRALARLGRFGDRDLIAEVLRCFPDDNDTVVVAALSAAEALARQGDPHVVEATRPLLGHRSAAVRVAALSTFVRMLPNRDPLLEDVVLHQMLWDENQKVRAVALKSLVFATETRSV